MKEALSDSVHIRTYISFTFKFFFPLSFCDLHPRNFKLALYRKNNEK